MAQRKRVRPVSPAVSCSSPLPASSPAPSSPAPSSLCLGQRKRYRRESSAASSTEGARVHPSRSSPPVSSPPPPGIDPCSKKAKFERQFKTATSSNEDVLRKSRYYLYATGSNQENRKADEVVDIICLCTLPSTFNRRRGW
jgi:hypothetical protein